jgi:diguanylate cyclase (GGDEF)-like protein
MRALEILIGSSFDIVISDLNMPKMDGIALTKNIKAMGIDVPIIVITGIGTIENAVESMKAGASDFITKPLSFEHIDFRVQKTLETIKLQKLAIKSEFYKKLSNSDELTGLANYRYFKEALKQEIDRAERYDRPLSLMILDIDDFKSCNDTFGHLAGDMVLKHISSLIKKNTRGIDLVARYGGEEFTVILPETPVDETLVVAERIRYSIDKFVFKTDDGQPINNLTVTIGLSSFPDKAKSLTELIETADTALYKGKSLGKNRVVLYNCD